MLNDNFFGTCASPNTIKKKRSKMENLHAFDNHFIQHINYFDCLNI